MRDRQAGAEKNAGLDVGGKTTSPSVACLHRGVPVGYFLGVMPALAAGMTMEG
jgi:hypothetical protein